MTPPPINQKEVLRYLGVKLADENILSLLEECLKEIDKKLVYKVCFCELPFETNENICDFKVLKLKSKNLCDNLKLWIIRVLFQ